MASARKMNVVLLTDCMADLAGGAEKQIYELARRLDKNAYNVFVVSLDSWGQAPRHVIESTGSQLHVFKVVRIYGVSGLAQGFKFRRFLQQHKIDVILTYHFSSDMWGTFWGRLAGVRRIISNRRDMGFWRNGGHVAAYRLINPWVHKIVVVADSIKQLVIQSEGYASGRIEVIYNGVDLPPAYTRDIAAERAKFGLSPEDVVIMHVANLKPVKGHEYLLKAMAGLAAKCSRVRLVLIGRDELDGRLHNMVKELNIEKYVQFWGKREDIAQLLPLADIGTLPSMSEGMSNAILEYMAAAKPAVVTNVGGNPELVRDGFNGFLVEKADAAGLEGALSKLVEDADLRRRMGHNGLQRVINEFSMAAMMGRYTEVLQADGI